MISEKELKKEIAAVRRFIKSDPDAVLVDDALAYLDGLMYALKGKLE